MGKLLVCESIFVRWATVLGLLLNVGVLPAKLEAQTCAGQVPARYVPGPPPEHDPDAPGIDLWLDGTFRPGLTGLANRQLPAERDSTAWDSLDTTGYTEGFEIFESLDIAGDYLYVAYNVGFSIWDISGANSERPRRIKVRDGFHFLDCQQDPTCGPFLSFPPAGHGQFLIEDIDVLPEPGTNNVYIAVSGERPVGLTLWRFNTATRNLTALYQDPNRVSRQVRLVSFAGDGGTPKMYVFSSFSGGVAIYDVSQAAAIGPCLEAGSNCPGVDLGAMGTLSRGHYVDVMQRPTGEFLVAASDGGRSDTTLGLELWQVDDPSSPGAAIQLFSGLDVETYGSALFNYEDNDYLATVEYDGALDLNVIKIFDINACGGGPCSLGTPVFDDIGVTARPSNQLLTYSTSNGTPFLYYGIQMGLGGAKTEQLLNLTTLGREGQNITEMTDGGPTYFDTGCTQADLGYWAWYYPGNEYGLKNMAPRVGKFHPENNIFYRAARGVLDTHVWTPPAPKMITSVVNPAPDGLYWMTDEITFEAEGSDGCTPAGTWTWTTQAPPEIDVFLVGEADNHVTFTFECNAASRCGGAVARVSGTNSDSSCADAEETAAAIFMKDPTVGITGIEPSSGTFDQCDDVDFTAAVVGRGPVDLAWSVRRGPEQDPDQEVQQTFEDLIEIEDLAASTPTFTWNTAASIFAGIFADGFESGDISAWGQPARLLEDFVVEARIGDDGPSSSVMVELSTCSP